VSLLSVFILCSLLDNAAAVNGSPDWYDDFDTFDTDKWEADAWLGGYNGEFHFYTGFTNRSKNLIIDNGSLLIQPDLTANYRMGSEFALGWKGVLGCGRKDPADANNNDCPTPGDTPILALNNPQTTTCDSPEPTMCSKQAGLPVERQGGPFKKPSKTYTVLPPVTSGNIRTKRAFKFGRLEIRAKLPRGDWLWPAIWLLPEDNVYGGWPMSGEIDIMESRGNKPNSCGPWQGSASFGSTLHFGPSIDKNAMLHTHTEASVSSGVSLSDDYHIYGLEWGEEGLYTYVDSPNNTVLLLNFTKKSFFQRGDSYEMVCYRRVAGKCTFWQPRWPAWSKTDPNPWLNSSNPNAAPFDQRFFLQMNVAVGGTGNPGFFPDLTCRNKPWSNADVKYGSNPIAEFLSAFSSWWPTWGGDVEHPEKGASRNASMSVDWVRYWEP
jgi:hypothetical protein